MFRALFDACSVTFYPKVPDLQYRYGSRRPPTVRIRADPDFHY